MFKNNIYAFNISINCVNLIFLLKLLKMISNCNVLINSSDGINRYYVEQEQQPFFDFLEISLGFTINFLAFVSNIINVFVFSRSELRKSKLVKFDLFKYYLLKSLIDTVHNFSSFLTYVLVVLFKYSSIHLVAHQIYYIFTSFASSSSDAIDIIATLILIALISDDQRSILKFMLSKIGFSGFSIGIILLSIFLSIPRFFQADYFTMCIYLMSDIPRFRLAL